MNGISRIRVWMPGGIAAVIGLVTLLALRAPDWIEALCGWDPDRRDGSLERLIVIGLCGMTALSALLAARQWRRDRTAGAA